MKTDWRPETGDRRRIASSLRPTASSLLWTILLCVASASAAAELKPLDEAGYQKLVRSHRGKVLLVDFWATWCEPCRQEMPSLVRMAEKYAPRGFRLATVSADQEEELGQAEQFLRSRRVPFPGYYKKARDDSAFINSVDRDWSGALPAVFLYDADGRLAAKFVGETDAGQVEAAIQRALASKYQGMGRR